MPGGKGTKTFSNPIKFATLVQDNSIAALAGGSPEEGHPTYVREMYSTLLPNTQLELRFEVKEWVQPAGRDEENKLVTYISIILPVNGDGGMVVEQLAC